MNRFTSFVAARGQKRSFFSVVPTSLKGTTSRGDITAGSCVAIFRGICDTNSSKDEGCIFGLPLLLFPTLRYFTPRQPAPLLCFPSLLLSSDTVARCTCSHQSPQRPPGDLFPLCCPPGGTCADFLHIPKYGHESPDCVCLCERMNKQLVFRHYI